MFSKMKKNITNKCKIIRTKKQSTYIIDWNKNWEYYPERGFLNMSKTL